MYRWSPPHENDTEVVIYKMSKYLGIAPDTKIPLSHDFLINLGRMIIRMEQSYNPYTIRQHRVVVQEVFK